MSTPGSYESCGWPDICRSQAGGPGDWRLFPRAGMRLHLCAAHAAAFDADPTWLDPCACWQAGPSCPHFGADTRPPCHHCGHSGPSHSADAVWTRPGDACRKPGCTACPGYLRSYR